jgi:hypothetical protein
MAVEVGDQGIQPPEVAQKSLYIRDLFGIIMLDASPMRNYAPKLQDALMKLSLEEVMLLHECIYICETS